MPNLSHLEIAELKYRPLKKNLKVPFQKIRKVIEAGGLPDSQLLAEYLALAQVMISYPGFGDKQYNAFWQACLSFERACRSGKEDQAHEAFISIMTIKDSCHHSKKKTARNQF